MSQIMYPLFIIILLPGLVPAADKVLHDVSVGGCVVAQAPHQMLTASSARSCAFLCSQLRLCIGWSYRTGVCNVSDSVQTVRLTNDTDCEVWSVLRQLSLVAFWPMSNATRSRNVASNSGRLDLQENIPMQYTDSAVNFTGQFDVDERFNIDQLASECLTSFTFSVWVKVSNSSRGPMPLLEGLTMPSGYFTALWLHPHSSGILLMVSSPSSKLAVPGPTDTASGWTHIAAVYDWNSPAIRIFVNGTLVTSSSALAVTSSASFGSSVQIGAITRYAAHNRVFQGCMRCFGVSQRALSSSEVTLLLQTC